MANKKYNIEELRQARSMWTEPLISTVPESKRSRYMLKKQAVDMYIDGESVKKITEMTGIPGSRMVSLIERCLSSNDAGNILGYHGLLTGSKPFRETRSGHGREFDQLLEKYPQLKEFIIGCYFGDRKYTLVRNMNITSLHRLFLKECRNLGITEWQYPFTTENRGYVSMCAYVHKLEADNISLNARRFDKNTAQKLASTGIGHRLTVNPVAPFATVQIDGHIIDIEYVIDVPNTDGTVSKVVATRAWLIAVIDIATRCILGYSLSQEFNYDQYDVMDAIKNAIIPKTLLDLTIEGLQYPSNGGFYSTAFSDFKYAVFDSIMLDNAKSHLSAYTVGKLVDELGCCVNYGSVATPETRGIVERFFGTLESRGFHMLPSTTGSDTKDPVRKSPEKNAIKYDVTYEQMTELIDVLIAEYNNTPHKGVDGLSPLECMSCKLYQAGLYPYVADEDMIISVIERLNMRMDKRTVRGRATHGKHAYIQFMGTEYRSKILSATEHYLGQSLTILYDPRDISSIEAYDQDGRYIDTLKASGEFGTKSHSVRTRKNALKLAKERGRSKLIFDTPIDAYISSLDDKGKKSRRNATRADIVRREISKGIAAEQQSDNTFNLETVRKKQETGAVLRYEDIKGLSPEDLYTLMFQSRKEG